MFENGSIDAAFRAQYIRAATLAYQRFQTLLGGDYGVRWIENDDCSDLLDRGELQASAQRLIPELYPEIQKYGPGDHPFPTRSS